MDKSRTGTFCGTPGLVFFLEVNVIERKKGGRGNVLDYKRGKSRNHQEQNMNLDWILVHQNPCNSFVLFSVNRETGRCGVDT